MNGGLTGIWYVYVALFAQSFLKYQIFIVLHTNPTYVLFTREKLLV